MRTLNQLIEELEGFREDWGGDTEVRMAYQPSWPLQSHIEGVAVAPEHESDVDDGPAPDDCPMVVYIVEGSQVRDNPYARKDLWR